jgi:hypothetical protein
MVIPELFEVRNEILLQNCRRSQDREPRDRHEVCLQLLSEDPLSFAFLMNSVQVMRHVLHYFEPRMVNLSSSTPLDQIHLPDLCSEASPPLPVAFSSQEILSLHARLVEAVSLHRQMLLHCSPSLTSEESSRYFLLRSQVHETYQRFLQDTLQFARSVDCSDLVCHCLTDRLSSESNGLLLRCHRCQST